MLGVSVEAVDNVGKDGVVGHNPDAKEVLLAAIAQGQRHWESSTDDSV